MSRICIGIPCYQNAPAETLEDYMRFMYYIGRRMPEHDFILAIKSKTEQYRARNAIVTGALQAGCDYLLFLDDDQIIDWEVSSGPNSRYGLINQFLRHMDDDLNLGIVGGMYYHRGAECRPVLMKLGHDGGYYWLRDDEITGQLQEVSVVGGGCLFLRLSALDKVQSPWFEPEFDLGTDIQICKKVADAGFKVKVDSSIILGHVLSRREVITPNNRARVAADNATVLAGGGEGVNRDWKKDSALGLYVADAEEYLGMKIDQFPDISERYNMAQMEEAESLEEYYSKKGPEQLARQVLFHLSEPMKQQFDFYTNLINSNSDAKVIDFGCGSAPIGFELAMRGHDVDFIDIDGSTAYEFTKWRAEKRGLYTCNFEMTGGPYNYALFMDSIEHVENWQIILQSVIDELKEGGFIITNYFNNMDFENAEHISMDHGAVAKFLTDSGLYPQLDKNMWVKVAAEEREIIQKNEAMVAASV